MELYNNGGKHAKQNPSVGKQGTPILAIILVISLLTSCMGRKNDKPIANGKTNDIPMNQANDLPNFNSNFVGMIDKWQEGKDLYYDNEHKMMNTYGYVSQFVISLFEDKEINPDSNSVIFNKLCEQDLDLLLKAKKYVHSVNRGYDIRFIDTQDINVDNIKVIENSPILLNTIKKYAEMYGVSPELIISMAASNVKDGRIDYSNVMGIPLVWGNLPSRRTAHNLKTGEKDSLIEQQGHYLEDSEQNVKYACMMISQCLKESSGDLEMAIKYYYTGSPSMDNNHSNGEEQKNTVLSYLFAYKGSRSVMVEYIYTLDSNSKTKTIVFEDEDYCLDCVSQIARWMELSQKAYATGRGM